FSNVIHRVLGDGGTTLVTRLAGLLLAAIAAQLMADAVLVFIEQSTWGPARPGYIGLWLTGTPVTAAARRTSAASAATVRRRVRCAAVSAARGTSRNRFQAAMATTRATTATLATSVRP